MVAAGATRLGMHATAGATGGVSTMIDHTLLSSAIYTQDVNQAFYAMQELYTGICYVNSATIGAEVHLPFGGTKGTGNGHREAGTQVLDIFSEWKSIYVDYSGKLQKAQIDLVEI
jgi:aldehyde dehydrogenase (NAD+)